MCMFICTGYVGTFMFAPCWYFSPHDASAFVYLNQLFFCLCVYLCLFAGVSGFAVTNVCVCLCLMMLFCQRREETPVTIVMRGIYISYLAVNHSVLLSSCLIPTRQVCVCVCVHACVCMHVC